MPDDLPTDEQLLDDIIVALRRYVVFASEAQAVAVALWVVHTHAIEAAETTLYLAITSPEPRSGKTRLLDVLELLTAGPWRAIMPTAAVLFRSIAQDHPTLLLDEVDAIFGPAGSASHEAMRAVLNEGHHRGATVRRVETIDGQRVVVHYPVFCAKAFAGVGRPLPYTVADRSIPIRMHRRAAHEQIARFRRRDAVAALQPLHDRIDLWAKLRIDDLARAVPAVPPELQDSNDRAAEGWESLLAIADLFGGGWPDRARAAAVLLHGTDTSETVNILLLRHIRDAFDKARTDKLSTRRLLRFLVDRDDGPWSELWGDAVRQGDLRGPGYRLRDRLKQYGIQAKKFRLGAATHRGYLRSDFEEVWARYLRDDATDDPNDGTMPRWTATRLDEESPVFRRSIDPPSVP